MRASDTGPRDSSQGSRPTVALRAAVFLAQKMAGSAGKLRNPAAAGRHMKKSPFPETSWLGRQEALRVLPPHPHFLAQKMAGSAGKLRNPAAAGRHMKKSPFPETSWLGRQDSNLRMLGPKPSALPLGDDPNYAHYTTPTHSMQQRLQSAAYFPQPLTPLFAPPAANSVAPQTQS